MINDEKYQDINGIENLVHAFYLSMGVAVPLCNYCVMLHHMELWECLFGTVRTSHTSSSTVITMHVTNPFNLPPTNTVCLLFQCLPREIPKSPSSVIRSWWTSGEPQSSNVPSRWETSQFSGQCLAVLARRDEEIINDAYMRVEYSIKSDYSWSHRSNVLFYIRPLFYLSSRFTKFSCLV